MWEEKLHFLERLAEQHPEILVISSVLFGGFFLIDAKDLDEAISIAGRIPAARKGTVEVRPVFELDGLGSRRYFGSANQGPGQHRGLFCRLSAQKIAHDAMQTGAYGLHRVDYNDEHGPIENTKELFMKKLIFLMVVLAGAFAHAQNIVGDWQGALRVGPSELRLVLHIAKADNGGFKATLDSIDQAANGIPVSSISLK